MVGICIKYFHENYGGSLQAYATIKFFQKNNIEYKLLRYYPNKDVFSLIKNFPRIFNKVWLNSRKEGIQRKINLKINKKYRVNNEIRMKKFSEFKNKNFKEEIISYYGYKELLTSNQMFNYFITGSDQLWSPAGLPTNFFNLNFVDENKIKISIASSFGVKKIPWYQKTRTKEYLNRINYISMREISGCDIVKKLTNKNVPHILDPVFYLSKDEWDELIPNKKIINEKYIFAYFLGKNKQYREEVKKYAKENNLKILAIKHMDQYIKSDEEFGDIVPYDAGPEEFLNYLRNAECVFTDSFHGLAFSIINKKEFVVFNRYSNNSKISKNSRIDSLCEIANLNDRRYNLTATIESILSSKINYKNVELSLVPIFERTFLYLKEIISYIKEEKDENN